MNIFERFVGVRYTRAKRDGQFVSFIAAISIAGIALGVAALIIVLSVMNGFQKEIRGRLLDSSSHIEVLGYDGQLQKWAEVKKYSLRHPSVLAAAPFVSGQALLNANGVSRGVLVRGVDPVQESTVVTFNQHMVAGKFDALQAGEFGLLMGRRLAEDLNVKLGDKVTVITPDGNISPAGVTPRLKQFKLVGLFNMDMATVDSGLVMVALNDAQKLYRLNEAVTGVRLKLQDAMQARTVKEALQKTYFGDLPVYASDWTDQNSNYFEAVQLEKRMMFIILAVIILVATFNLLSTLVVTVAQKQADIAILRTLGATPSSIMQIFMLQGLLVGLFGTLLGVGGGLLVACNIERILGFLEQTLHIHILPPAVYLMSTLPSDPHATDVFWVACMALLFSFLATLYPSWRAAQVNPAEALRYE